MLALLKAVLPKVSPDPAFADKLYAAFEAELRSKNRGTSFEKLCERIELPDLEAQTLETVREQLVATFGDADVDIQPDDSGKFMTVDLSPAYDGSQFVTKPRSRPSSFRRGQR